MSVAVSGAFGLATYVYFIWVFTLSLLFVGNYTGPVALQLVFPYGTIDGLANAKIIRASGDALLSNCIPLVVFAMTHVIMARSAFKAFMARHLYGEQYERTWFVLVANISLHYLIASWKPLATPVLTLPPTIQPFAFYMPMIGYIIALIATFNIDHLNLFGVKQSLCIASPKTTTLVVTGLYSFVRHPIMLGFLIAFWCAPVITIGRLLFALMTTAFIFFAVYLFEEPDMVKMIGKDYIAYQKTTPGFCPFLFSFGTSKLRDKEQ